MKKPNIYLLFSLFVLGTFSLSAQSSTNEGNLKFAFEYYKELTRVQDNNFIYSPISISSSMSMAYLGAVGETKDEIQETFYFYTDAGKNLSQMKGVHKELNSIRSNDVKLINTLWVQKGYELKKNYVKALEDNFTDGLKYVDYISSSQVSRVMINNWVAKNTNNNVKELLDRSAINSRTRLLMVNALYFNGNWANPFDRDQTQDNTFILADNTKTRTAFMRASPKEYNYYQDHNAQVIEMPYEGNKTSMVVVLPKDQKAFQEIEKTLSYHSYIKWIKGFERRAVKVNLPKFTLGATMDIDAHLAAMGMTNAFSNRANFGKMSPKNDLRLDKIVHKSIVKVSEKGTEAAASTGVISKEKGVDNLPAATFNANRPFMFFIKENASQNILFIGRFMTPKEINVNISDEKMSFANNSSKGRTTSSTGKHIPRPPRKNYGNGTKGVKNKIIPLSKNSIFKENSEPTPIASATITRKKTPPPLIPYAEQVKKTEPKPFVRPKKVGPEIHVVKTGETLYSIAQENNVSVKQIKQWNNLNNDVIEIGQYLKVRDLGVVSTAVKTEKKVKVHIVKTGETLYEIAHKYGMNVAALKKRNAMKSNEIEIGQRLFVDKKDGYILKGGTPKGLPCDCKKHIVEGGETLYSIAKKYNKTITRVKYINQLKSDILEIGQTLMIEK